MAIKDWWQNLAEREQRIVQIGGIAVGVLLLYVWIWTPLTTAVDRQRDSIQKQAQLLTYLHQASATINRLRASGIRVISDDTQDVTTQAESVFSSHGVSAFIKQVQQPEANSVIFVLESVPFDELMRALHALTLSGVKIVAFSSVRQSVSGTADVRVTLAK